MNRIDFFVDREKQFDEFFPWDILDHGIRKEYLIKEYLLATKGKDSARCKPISCRRCGVCERIYYSTIS